MVIHVNLWWFMVIHAMAMAFPRFRHAASFPPRRTLVVGGLAGEAAPGRGRDAGRARPGAAVHRRRGRWLKRKGMAGKRIGGTELSSWTNLIWWNLIQSDLIYLSNYLSIQLSIYLPTYLPISLCILYTHTNIENIWKLKQSWDEEISQTCKTGDLDKGREQILLVWVAKNIWEWKEMATGWTLKKWG